MLNFFSIISFFLFFFNLNSMQNHGFNIAEKISKQLYFDVQQYLYKNFDNLSNQDQNKEWLYIKDHSLLTFDPLMLYFVIREYYEYLKSRKDKTEIKFLKSKNFELSYSSIFFLFQCLLTFKIRLCLDSKSCFGFKMISKPEEIYGKFSKKLVQRFELFYFFNNFLNFNFGPISFQDAFMQNKNYISENSVKFLSVNPQWIGLCNIPWAANFGMWPNTINFGNNPNNFTGNDLSFLDFINDIRKKECVDQQCAYNTIEDCILQMLLLYQN